MRLKTRFFLILELLILLIAIPLASKEKWSPDFIIVGAQKAGTGALREYLIQHPLIVFSKKKEVHFFDRRFKNGVQWYEHQFPVRPSAEHLLGEKTPYYIVHPSIPHRVFSLFPKVKIIMILRNPVSRAYSHYQFNVRNGVEPLSFEEAIEAEPERLQENKMGGTPFSSNHNFKYYSYLTRGMYIDQIKRWLKYFPKKQILILTSEDLNQNPLKVVNEIYTFLGLPLVDQLDDIELKEEKKNNPYAPMNGEFRKTLIEFFRPYNRQLSVFLNRDFDWDK